MGYYMSQNDSSFFIAADQTDDALQAIKDLKGRETIKDASGRHFSWVSQNFHEASNLKDILEHWGWSPEIDDSGNVVDIQFERSKLGDEEILFAALAPFVKPGSYIEMEGEDSSHWRWWFDGKSVVEKTATLVWDY